MNKVGLKWAIVRLAMIVVNNVVYAIVIAHGKFCG